MIETGALVENILAGDEGAFRELIETHQKLVSHVVFRMVSNETDREDICQEIFIKVYQNLPGFRFESKISTWIARIAYNSCVNYLGKKKLPLLNDINKEAGEIKNVSGGDIAPDRYTESREISHRLAEEIDRLPVIYGTILSLFHLEDMSYNEITEIMHLPGGTVKSYLFRARKMLKNRLLAKYQREEL